MEGIEKTKQSFFQKLSRAVAGHSRVDDDTLDAIEDALVASDMGVDTTLKIIERLEDRVERDKFMDFNELVNLLREEIGALVIDGENAGNALCPQTADGKPYVIMVVGVNGVGKTTSIGKLAYLLKNEGKKVLLAAGDTFRAAAAEQLTIWAERLGVDIIKHGEGADPSAVIFDGLAAAKARGTDVIICDTAGRLHNKKNLMNELAKMNKVIDREYPGAARETLLVLDATTGKNAVSQAKEFNEVTELTGIVLTKLDGTAKGGIVITIADEFDLPVKYIGVGEGMDDLRPFDPHTFAESIFEEE